MTLARDSYLGWSELQHHTGCARPVWVVDVRTEYDVVRDRSRYSTAAHACPDEECGHGPRMERTTVRIVCSSCGMAHVMAGEDELSTTSTRHLGYGLPPRQISGLLLWPGEPLLSYGRLSPEANEPWDYLVTGPGVTRVRAEDVVGEITQTRGTRGAVRYSAAALPTSEGTYGYAPYRWQAARGGLKTVTAAVKWIAAQDAQAAEAAQDTSIRRGES